MGQKNNFRADAAANLACQKNMAVIKHGILSIQYLNSDDGMRQNFILDRKASRRPGLKLSFGAVLQDLTMSIEDQAVCFRNEATGELEFQYSDLNVWDSNGRILPSAFQANSPTEFSILVDDSRAIYPILVDPLSFMSSFTESQSGCKFGFSVAQRKFGSADGHLIIGAPYYDGGETDEGKVFVFNDLGSSGFSSSADWTAESNEAGANFGWSVAAVDLSNDGNYIDFVVGAPFYGTGLSEKGKVFGWYGSSTGLGSSGTPSNADWTATGEEPGNRFGWSVAGAKLRQDNKFSLIVGAPYFNVPSEPESPGFSLLTHVDLAGKVYVFYGDNNGTDTTVDWTYAGTSDYEYFGTSVASAGDVNDDTDEELLAGSPGSSSTTGKVRIWYGSTTGLGSGGPSATLHGDSQSGAEFGWAVSSAGDVNDDTYADIIIGAPKYSNGQTNEGRVYVYHGSSSGIGTSVAWRAESNQASAQFGYSVASGDYDNDTISSVIVGAPYYDFTDTDAGRVFLWDGSASGLGSDGTPTNADWATTNLGANHHTGFSVGFFENLYFRGVIVGVPGDENVTLWDYAP